MNLSMKIRVSKRRTIVIPKAIAEALGIDEGTRLKLEVKNDAIVLKPIPDAIQFSIHGKKIAKITLEELEAESTEQQKSTLRMPKVLIDTTFLLPALGIDVEKKQKRLYHFSAK